MTKSQSGQAFNTASGQQATTGANAQSSYQAAQGDIGNYQDALSQYAAQNPYVQGGQAETANNQQLADTAAAGSTAAQQAITGSMVRSGENPTAAVAAGEQVAENNARSQMGAEASANQARLQGLAGYNTNVVNDAAKPEEMEAGLNSTELSGSNSALGQENDAAKTPSFWQELGQGVISAGGQFAGAAGKAAGACWIAARVFNGWTDPRTAAVRLWLIYCVSKTWWGRPLVGLYRLLGERIADDWMPKSKMLTAAMRWLFTRLLGYAERWKQTGEGARLWRLYCHWHREIIQITPRGWDRALADTIFYEIGKRPDWNPPGRPEPVAEPRFMGVL